MSEAVRCILDFYLIGRALPPIDACGEDLPHLIEKAVRGADDPVKDRSHARNLQFELYLAAWFKAGGVDVAMPIEPDLQIDYFGSAAGVAAKRVTSVSKIVRRTKEGAKQVHAHTVSGFVALNVDAFIDELTPTETSNLRRLPELEKSRSALSNSNLLGLLIFGTAVEWTEHEPPQLGIRLAAEHQILPRGLADRERLQEFFTNLRATQERRLADI